MWTTATQLDPTDRQRLQPRTRQQRGGRGQVNVVTMQQRIAKSESVVVKQASQERLVADAQIDSEMELVQLATVAVNENAGTNDRTAIGIPKVQHAQLDQKAHNRPRQAFRGALGRNHIAQVQKCKNAIFHVRRHTTLAPGCGGRG